MSRSRRRTPVCGITTCRSEKSWKQDAHRRLRVAERAMVDGDPEPRLRDVSNPWSFGKDGKQRLPAEWIARNPKLMRK